ncbi:MAG TPA: SDR family oxidoreductase [bacterium]|jgi:uncharacterized protein YbjT (DUF2867 family)|nr:SDR family oxidoreductase [bacterium]
MILVTSATGTVGSEVVKQLKATGLPLTAASREPATAQAKLGVPAVAWNWDRPGDFAGALKGVSTLFLGTPPGLLEEQAYGMSAVAAAKEAGVKKIVKLSAIGVEHMPESAHRRIELAIEAGGFQWVFLRPGFFMQNLNEGMVQGIKESGVIALPAGDGRTSFIDARDIAAVAVKALTSDVFNGQGLTLTGSEALGYVDVAAHLSRAVGKPVRYDDVAPALFTAAMLKAGMSKHYAEFLTTLYDQVVRKGFAATLTDNVEKITGKPPILFAQYAKDYAPAFKA